jgi:hypothetical protein
MARHIKILIRTAIPKIDFHYRAVIIIADFLQAGQVNMNSFHFLPFPYVCSRHEDSGASTLLSFDAIIGTNPDFPLAETNLCTLLIFINT